MLFKKNIIIVYKNLLKVIAGVNVAYYHAMNGRFASALLIIEQLRKRFSLENNWQVLIKKY